MSLFDSASLVVTPNGVKEDKLYSIKPTDGSGDLVVTRATTATRVNSDGLIEQVPYNLLTFSNTFTNAIWTKDNVSLTSGITSPSGLNNAFKLVESATTGVHSIYQTFVSLPSNIYTTSIYVKKGERFKVAIADRNSGAYVSFNLNTGTILASLSLVGTIELLNNDWYRLTAKTSSAISVYVPQIFILEDSYTTGVPITLPYAGNGTSGIFIYAAQFEAGATAKEYFPTTDRLDIPRLDYTNSSCPSILVEPQRTNIILNSQNFTAASWSATATTITANAGISPDGNNNANKFIPNTSATSHFISQIINSSLNGSISIYAKADGYNNITLLTSNTNVNYNLSTGTVQAVGGVGTGEIQSVGNGWYRCILYKVLATETIYISCGSNTNAGFFNGSGNGTSGVLIWGAQVEVGSYATSYIPTIASSVTRNADVISKTGISSLIGQTEGTIYAEINNTLRTYQEGYLIRLFADANNEVWIRKEGGTNTYSARFRANSVNVYTKLDINVLNGNNKIAFAYKSGDLAIYLNGTQIGTSSSTGAFSATVGDLNLGYTSTAFFNDRIKSAIVWKERLTNDELAQLTTI